MRRVFRIRDTDRSTVAEHVRVPTASGGKSMYWRLPGVPENGLGGLGTADLPLYGAHMIRRYRVGQTVAVCEGERATEALWSFRCPAVGTVTGASGTPSEDALAVLLPFDVVLWPDHDAEGRDHMARVAARFIQLGGSCRLLRWRGAADKGDDAADFAARGGSSDELDALIAAARPVQAVYRDPPKPAAVRRLVNHGDADDRKDRARETLAEVVAQRLGHPVRREGRSLFWCCPFHGEKTASFKVDLKEPFFRCFGCGARGDVFSFLGRMDGRTFKETLADLAPVGYTGILGRYAE